VRHPARSAGGLLLATCALLSAVGDVGAQDAVARRGLSVRITEPANLDIVFGRTRIAAEVRSDEPALVQRVEFLVGDDVVFVDREPPWECVHDFGEQSRMWVIRVIAHHAEGVSVSDAIITRRMAYAVIERVNRVNLWITGTDRDGGLVTDLKREELRVFEEDEEQQILEFQREDRPIVLAMILDSSGSMQDKLDELHAAASGFVETLRPEDRALVIDFDEKVFLIQDLTSDRQALKEAIGSTQAIGGTALYDALHAAYRKIGAIDGRKAIILLSDGEDTASQLPHDRVLEEVKSNSAMLYTIGLGGWGTGPRKGVLKELAEVTGGRAFFVAKASELSEAYGRIAEETRAQFSVAYSTDNEQWDGRWIKVRVECLRPGVKLRTRPGYFAVRGSMLGG
jgi:Ca-activated chloride channel family protein